MPPRHCDHEAIMAQGYIPIDCGLHDHLEVHATRRDLLDVDFVDEEGRPRRLRGVRLATWRSRGGEEIGVFVGELEGETLIRLDRLRSILDRRTHRRLDLTDPVCPAPAAVDETRPAVEAS